MGRFTRKPQSVGQASIQSALLHLPVPWPGVGSGCCSRFLSLAVFVVGFSLSLSLVFVCLLLLLFDGFVVIVALCFFGGAAVFSGVGQDHCPTEIISVGAKICMSTKRPFVYFYALFFLPRTACMPIKM